MEMGQLFDFWYIKFGPVTNRKEIRNWARKNMTDKYTVDIGCDEGITEEYWTFNSKKDAILFALKWT